LEFVIHSLSIFVPSALAMSATHSTRKYILHRLINICSFRDIGFSWAVSMMYESFTLYVGGLSVALIILAFMCCRKSRMLGIQPHSIYDNDQFSSNIGDPSPDSI
jgi:hypothetical protein